MNDGKIASGSELIITGKGGLPSNTSLRTPMLSYLGDPSNIQDIADDSISTISQTQADLEIAQGWQKLPDGKLQLIASNYHAQQSLVQRPYCLEQET